MHLLAILAAIVFGWWWILTMDRLEKAAQDEKKRLLQLEEDRHREVIAAIKKVEDKVDELIIDEEAYLDEQRRLME